MWEQGLKCERENATPFWSQWPETWGRVTVQPANAPGISQMEVGVLSPLPSQWCDVLRRQKMVQSNTCSVTPWSWHKYHLPLLRTGWVNWNQANCIGHIPSDKAHSPQFLSHIGVHSDMFNSLTLKPFLGLTVFSACYPTMNISRYTSWPYLLCIFNNWQHKWPHKFEWTLGLCWSCLWDAFNLVKKNRLMHK